MQPIFNPMLLNFTFGSVAQRIQADSSSTAFAEALIHSHTLAQANIHIHAQEENIHFLIRA